MKQSGMLKRQSAAIDFYANAYKDIIQQFMIDTLQITLHETEGFGYERLERLGENWHKTRMEYYPALDPKDPECDVKQEHMDRIFRRICKGREIIPASERYPGLKKPKY